MKEPKNKRFLRREKSSGQKLLPSLKKEVKYFLSGEEAKITPAKVLLGATSVVMFEVLFAEYAISGHSNDYVHGNSNVTSGYWHANAHGSASNFHGNQLQHTNLNPSHINTVPHGSAGTQHASAGYGLSSTNPHSNATAPAVNTHANESTAVTKGYFHNNASQGTHQAFTGHDNIPNIHANAAAVHTSLTPHTNAYPHNNAAPHVSYSPHDSSSVGHYSVAPHRSVNPHVSNHGSSVTHGQHCNHASHGQW